MNPGKTAFQQRIFAHMSKEPDRSYGNWELANAGNPERWNNRPSRGALCAHADRAAMEMGLIRSVSAGYPAYVTYWLADDQKPSSPEAHSKDCQAMGPLFCEHPSHAQACSHCGGSAKDPDAAGWPCSACRESEYVAKLKASIKEAGVDR